MQSAADWHVRNGRTPGAHGGFRVMMLHMVFLMFSPFCWVAREKCPSSERVRQNFFDKCMITSVEVREKSEKGNSRHIIESDQAA
jgi:hypothetical protein